MKTFTHGAGRGLYPIPGAPASGRPVGTLAQAEWIRLFVEQMVMRRGKRAEPLAIEDLARALYPVCQQLTPAEAVERETPH